MKLRITRHNEGDICSKRSFNTSITLFLGERIPAPNKGRCSDIKPSKCFDCSIYYDSKSKKSDEDKKCVWIPERKVCRNKKTAKIQEELYVEVCPGKKSDQSFPSTLLDNYKIKTQFLNFKMMNPHTFGYNRKISTIHVRSSK